MELIDIVDKNGNFTGEVLEKEIAHDRNLLHNEIACFVINSNNEILLQKRSMNKRFNPGKWGLCAGHVDSGESLEDATIREIKEEIGLDLTVDELHTFTEREVNIKEKNSHIAYFYYLVTDKKEDEFVIQEEELSEVKWFNVDYIIELVEKGDTSTVFTKDRLRLLNDIKKVMK